MKNENFSVSDIEHALAALGVDYLTSQQRDPGALRFCSYFAQEHHGIYFWEDKVHPPAFADEDIVVFTSVNWPDIKAACIIEVTHPQATYYRVMQHFFAADDKKSGIHPSAIVSPNARIGRGVYIGPYCVIEDCEIGDDSFLDAHVVVKDRSIIGQRVRIESHSTIGATGVAWVWHQGQRIIQPQIGSARVSDDCFLGTDITIVRGSINEQTSLGRGCVLAHGTKIGHGSRVGDEVHFANNVSIAGNCHIGARAFLGSACVLRPRVRLGTGVTVGAGAVVTRNFDESGSVVSGVPARKMADKDQYSGVPRSPCVKES